VSGGADRGDDVVYAAAPGPDRRIEMRFNGPEQQRRWTVLLRFFLAIPQAIVLFVLEIALIVVTIIGWFAALFMGRLPLWAHEFNSGYVRWYTRYVAYVYLLTDEYPPFEFDDRPYPARPFVAPPGVLNRLAVLFRIILVVPAAFFQAIVSYGLFFPMLFVAWLIMVFTGRMPRALYWAYSSWVRYSTRVMAYMLLITSEYPWGMLGDRVLEAPLEFPPYSGSPVSGFGAPAPYASPAPTAVTSADATLTAEVESGVDEGAGAITDAPGEAAAPGTPYAQPSWPPPVPPPPVGPPVWSAPPMQAPPWGSDPPPPPLLPPGADAERNRLALPSGARTWLIFAIVWGSILLVAQISLQAVLASGNLDTSIRQYNTVVSDFNNSRAAIDDAIRSSYRCTTVQCLRASHLAAAASLEKFDSDVKKMNLSCTATNPAQVVESDLGQMAAAFTELANSANGQAYHSALQSSNLNTLIQSLPNDTNDLLNAMSSSGFGSFCSG
jgi:hypothetical protein